MSNDERDRTTAAPLDDATSATDDAQPWREPPILTLPAVPADFRPTPGSSLRGYRPMKSEVAAAQRAVEEVAGIGEWSAIFGITAPCAARVVQRVGLALRWTAVVQALKPLTKYAESKCGDAWVDALDVVEDLKVPFTIAAKADPARMAAFPGLAALVRAQTEVATRAYASRLRNREAKAAASLETSRTQEPS